MELKDSKWVSDKDYFLLKDEGKTELAIVKHYMMKSGIDKKKWANLVKNRNRWDQEGVNACFYKTILNLHFHFLSEGEDLDWADPNAKVRLKLHKRAVRDFYTDDIEDLQKEIEDLRDNGRTILKEEHKKIVKDLEKEHERECQAMEDTIRKLKSQVAFAKDKAESQDRLHQKQIAFHKQTQDAMEKCHQSALRAAGS